MSYPGANVANLLGVKPKKAETTLTLAYSVEKGLPVSALDRFAGLFREVTVAKEPGHRGDHEGNR